MRKQTAYWKCKDGTNVRICDMTDSHLVNCIKLLRRAADSHLLNFSSFGGMLQGEMAIDSFEQCEYNLMQMNEDELAEEIFGTPYERLLNEAERRKLNVQTDNQHSNT